MCLKISDVYGISLKSPTVLLEIQSAMELNITAPSKPSSVRPEVSFKSASKVKGSWKKRHRALVIQRAKRDRPKSVSKNPKERAIQVQEFESGVELAAEKNPSENAPVAGAPRPAKRRKVQSDATRPSSKQKEASDILMRASSHGGFNPSKYQGEHGSPHSHVAVCDKPSVEAVNATMEVIGGDRLSAKTDSRKKILSKSSKKVSGNPDVSSDGSDDTDDPVPKSDKQISETIPTPSRSTFADTGLYRSICVHVTERLGFKMPTEVQRRVLDSMLNLADNKSSIDLLVRSATGSGKTLAYLLPIAHYLLNRSKRLSRDAGALAIILVPTRELAEQVYDEARLLFRPWHWLVVGSVVGGENKHHEKSRLKKGINVLVSTPGRLLDHMRNTQRFVYRHCEFLVLDEADRLLDLGFEADIKEIIHNLEKEAMQSIEVGNQLRSNILLSATLRKDVKRLAEFSLHEPIEISVGTKASSDEQDQNGKFAMPEELQQHFCIVDQRHRLETLACFLRLRALKDVPLGKIRKEESLPICKIIVFFSTCDSVDFHHHLFSIAKVPDELRTKNVQNDSLIPLKLFKIHGNHTQPERTAALRGFRQHQRAVLLCTDVAARGLDLKGLTFAIQYDPPTGGNGEELEYFHRAGRTARMGARGDALLFLLPSERAYVGKLESTGVKIAEISNFAALAALYPRVNMGDEGGLAYAARTVLSAMHESFEAILAGNKDVKNEAVAGFQAYCRAYATHAKEVRHFFHVKNLHLGHVARAFVLSDKPAEFAEMMAEIRKAKAEIGEDMADVGNAGASKAGVRETQSKREIAQAIAEGGFQPFNTQSTTLARRRREKGKGHESFKEMALEFGA